MAFAPQDNSAESQRAREFDASAEDGDTRTFLDILSDLPSDSLDPSPLDASVNPARKEPSPNAKKTAPIAHPQTPRSAQQSAAIRAHAADRAAKAAARAKIRAEKAAQEALRAPQTQLAFKWEAAEASPAAAMPATAAAVLETLPKFTIIPANASTENPGQGQTPPSVPIEAQTAAPAATPLVFEAPEIAIPTRGAPVLPPARPRKAMPVAPTTAAPAQTLPQSMPKAVGAVGALSPASAMQPIAQKAFSSNAAWGAPKSIARPAAGTSAPGAPAAAQARAGHAAPLGVVGTVGAVRPVSGASGAKGMGSNAVWGAPKSAAQAAGSANGAPARSTASGIRNGFEPSDAGRLSAQEESRLEALGVPVAEFLKIERAGIDATRASTQNAAFFSLREWTRVFAKRHPALAPWTQSPQWGMIRKLALSKIGATPLFEGGNQDAEWAKFTTRQMVETENEMLALAKRKTREFTIPPELMDQAFSTRPSMQDEQMDAVRACCSGDKAMLIMEGTAGAGKSFTLNAVREVYENMPGRTPQDEPGCDILGTAISWNAAMVLEEEAELKGCVAMAGLLIEMDRAEKEGRDYFKRRTLVIVDEAGLASTAELTRLMRHCAKSRHPVRLILTGDSFQLAPVSAGNALEALVEANGSARLDFIRRQQQDSHKSAVKHFCHKRAQNGLFIYWQQEAIHFCKDAESRYKRVVGDFVGWQLDHPTKQGLALANTNEEVRRLNLEIREAMKKAGRVTGTEYRLRVYDGKVAFEAPFAVGDQVVFRKNLTKQPIFKSQFRKLHEALTPEAREKARKARGGLFSSLLSSVGMGKPDEIQGHGLYNRSNGVILSIKPSVRRSGTFDIRVLLSGEDGGEVLVNTGDYLDDVESSDAKAAQQGQSGQSGQQRPEKPGGGGKAIPMTHNFASTVYSSQGQTVDRVMLLDSPQISCRLAYVGMSRHRELCDVYVDQTELTERMKKQIEREKESPWKTHAKKMAATPTESMLLAAMAQTWNGDNANQTAFMARKLANERRKRFPQPHEMLPWRAPEDNPDDHPKIRWEKSSGFGGAGLSASARGETTANPGAAGGEAVEPGANAGAGSRTGSAKPKTQEETAKKSSFLSFFARAKAVEKGAVVSVAEAADKKAPGELRIADLDGVSAELAQSLRGSVWDENRFGEERFLARDTAGEILSRYDINGRCVVGDREPTVFPNTEQLAAGLPAPFLIVPDARAALISHAHYRQKHAQSPEKIPHIVAAFADTDWSKLEGWTGRLDQAKVFVAWSLRDPGSFAKAQEVGQKLVELGARVSFNPKSPAQETMNGPSIGRKIKGSPSP